VGAGPVGDLLGSAEAKQDPDKTEEKCTDKEAKEEKKKGEFRLVSLSTGLTGATVNLAALLLLSVYLQHLGHEILVCQLYHLV